MDTLFDYNTHEYNKKEETEYLFSETHQKRGDIAIDLIKEVVNNKKPQRLLSIACSIGLYEEKIIKKLGLKVYGIDGAKDALKEAEKRGVITKFGDVSKTLPYHDASFDFVFAGEIIEHLIDTKKFLNEINRVLKSKGYLILTTPNLARVDDRIKFLFGKSPRHTTPIHPFLYLHIRPFTFDSLKNALILCGFNNIKLRTQAITIEFGNRRMHLFSKLLTGLFPTLGATLIVRAQKY
ncbi:MAG TPA: class I SAM-dependent methyltransferase [Patescibacteria group bacterium]|nr:class I SAM-dependent methyltransferase [Patescibacteria group bacterium]